MKNSSHRSASEKLVAETIKSSSLNVSQIQSSEPLTIPIGTSQSSQSQIRRRRMSSINSASLKQSEQISQKILPFTELADGNPPNQEESHSFEGLSSSGSQRSNSQGKPESDSVSSKVNSNSVTSRSSNKASRGSNGSLHESYQISTSSAGNSSRVTKLASNGSSNSSFAVVSTKSMNVNEYTTAICSKEEIKESINIYRSGKLRESLIAGSSRLPVKLLAEESKNQSEDKPSQKQQQDSQKSVPIVKIPSSGISLKQRRGNTLSRSEIEDFTSQFAEISITPVEKSYQNVPQLSNSQNHELEGGISSQEGQKSSYPATAHAVFADFSCQPEEEMDSHAEKDRKSQGEDEEWEQQAEEDDFADLQVKKQVDMLNSDDSEEEYNNESQSSAQKQQSKPCIFQPILSAKTAPVGSGIPFQTLVSSPQQELISQLPQQYLSSQEQADFLQTKKAFGKGTTSTFGASFFDPLQMQSQQQQIGSSMSSFVFENQPNTLPQIFPPIIESSSPVGLPQMMPFQISQSVSPQQQSQQQQQTLLFQSMQPMMMSTPQTASQSSQQYYPNSSPQQMCSIRPRGHLQISASSLFSSHSNSSYSLQSQQFQQQQQQQQQFQLQQQQQQQLQLAANNCGYSQASTADSDLINTFRSFSSLSAPDKQAEIVKFIQLQQLQQQQQQQQQQMSPQQQTLSSGYPIGYCQPDSAPFFQNFIPDQYFASQQPFQNQLQQPQHPQLQGAQYQQQQLQLQSQSQKLFQQSQQQQQQMYVPSGNISSSPAENFQIQNNNPSSLLDTSEMLSQPFSQQQLANYRSHHIKQLSCLQFDQSSPHQPQTQPLQTQQQQIQQYSAMVAAAGLLLNSSSMNLATNESQSSNNSIINNGHILGKGKKKLEIKEETVKYDIDLNRLEIDGRTTVYIKNIPNKYTLNCVLQTIQKNHAEYFDFFYLPIDFQNKCNVGYAFINFISPAHIRDFFLEFNGKKWKKFNSDKICNLKYARIQGRVQLEEHFENSSVMNQREKKFKPVFLSISDLIQSQKQMQQQEQQQQPQYQSQYQQQFFQPKSSIPSAQDRVQYRQSSFSNHQNSHNNTTNHGSNNTNKQYHHHHNNHNPSFKQQHQHPKQEYYVQREPQK